MNKNDECDIVKDLAIPYIENLVNFRSKAFIENHLCTCDNCKNYYNNMNSDIFDNIQNEKIDEQVEVNFMKKTNRYIKIIRNILASIIIVITFVGLIFAIKYQIISFIVNKSYKRMEELKTLNNYKLIEEETYIDNAKEAPIEILTRTYYYKDGKSKEEMGSSVFYYEDDSYYSINVFNDLKQINYNIRNYFKQTKGKIFEKIFLEIINSKNIPLSRMFYSVRKDNYDGTDCYVLRNGNEKNHFDIWIDKTTYTVLKTVEVSYRKYVREINWYLYEDEATNKDVDNSILETDLYKDYTRNYSKENIDHAI